MTPSISRLISLLKGKERNSITKDKLIDLEAKICTNFGFDFNFPGPIQLLERYMQILNYSDNEAVMDISFSICKF